MPENPTAAPIAPERQALLQGLASQAAAWWRDQIAGPGYLNKFNNGDTSRDGEFARVLASMVALKSPQPAESEFDRFERALSERVLAFLQRDPSPSRPNYEGAARYMVLSVDYAPEGELRKAAEEVRVSGFPWKTTMWVNWDADAAKCYLEVRCGYGAPTQRLPALGEMPRTTDC